VEVSPGDSFILLSHHRDTVANAIGEQLATVRIPGESLHRQDAPAFDPSFWLAPSGTIVYFSQPLLESNETRVRHVRVNPHQPIGITGIPFTRDASRLAVAPDSALVTSGFSRKSDRASA